MDDGAYDRRKRRARLSRVTIATVLATTLIVVAGVLIWLVFLPPFSGT